jgi:hypothetical protein
MDCVLVYTCTRLPDPRCLGMASIVDLTNNKQKGQLYTLAVRRDKKEKTQTIDHRQQSNHYLSTRVIPCEREHDCASN